MFKKILIPLVILGMVFFVQCTDDPILPDYSAGKGYGGGNGSGGGGGNGNGNGGGNGGNGGSGGLYGDLVMCARGADGVAFYTLVPGEQDEPGPAPLPLMISITDGKLMPVEATTYDPESPILVDIGIDQYGNYYENVNFPYEFFRYNELGELIIPDDANAMVKEVEFGRLNVVRAPQSVLDAALVEAINSLQQTGVTGITTDASGRLVAIIGNPDWTVNFDAANPDDVSLGLESDDKTIDAPRENVAIYQELLTNGFSGALSFLPGQFGLEPEDEAGRAELLLRIAFGAISAGADKTGSMNVDEFGYMNDWLLKWDDMDDSYKVDPLGDDKGRMYYDYSGFSYNRYQTYKDKYIRELVAVPGETAYYTYYSLYDKLTDLGLFTNPDFLPNYAPQGNYNHGSNPDLYITGVSAFAMAADDAIQVLEYIHGNTLIEYSPDFDESWNYY